MASAQPISPIQAQSMVQLIECGVQGVREAKVTQADTSSLELDRFMRLNKVAGQVQLLHLPAGTIILDVGGFDGSFALFVPQLRVWVVDPMTTGASGLQLPLEAKSFDVVVSIDALEHVERKDRERFLCELVRVCRRNLLINFPEARSACGQEVALKLTGNRFIREHVEFGLPSKEETIEMLLRIDGKLSIQSFGHTSTNVWLPWYTLFQMNKEAALAISAHLKANSIEEVATATPFLYELITCTFSVDNMS